jgi:hypothetical protein
MANARRTPIAPAFDANALREAIVERLDGVLDGSLNATDASGWAVDVLYSQDIPAKDALLAAALRSLAIAPLNLPGLTPHLRQLQAALTGKGEYTLKIRYDR